MDSHDQCPKWSSVRKPHTAAAPKATTNVKPIARPDVSALPQPWSTETSQTRNRTMAIAPRTLSSIEALSNRSLWRDLCRVKVRRSQVEVRRLGLSTTQGRSPATEAAALKMARRLTLVCSSAVRKASADNGGLHRERLECCHWSAGPAGIRWWHARAVR